MDKIAEMLYKAYMQTGKRKEESQPENMDEICKPFLKTLNKGNQYKQFLDLESCYLELAEIRTKSVIKYVLHLIYPEEQ